MSMLRTVVIAVLLALGSLGAVAQKDNFAQAYEKYEQGDLAQARSLIDRAIAEPGLISDPGVWLLRGFIYKDLFKGMQAGAVADSLRDEALTSLIRCLAQDSAVAYTKDCTQAFDYLAKTYYNDAARALNEMDPDRATQLYAKHKEAVWRLDAEHDFRSRDIEFSNALGTVFTRRYNQDREDTAWFEKAVRTYRQVLLIDPDNYGANYNLSTLFYNRGVYNIQKITPENDIPGIQDIQRVSRVFFNAALPYMLKAFDMNPARKETLLGLEGVYYSLQDTEKSEHYRQLYEALEPEDDN